MSQDFSDFQRVLADPRLASGAAAPDERAFDAIVIDRLKDKMMSALRPAIDQLGRIDCSKNPALSGRIYAELAWYLRGH